MTAYVDPTLLLLRLDNIETSLGAMVKSVKDNNSNIMQRVEAVTKQIVDIEKSIPELEVLKWSEMAFVDRHLLKGGNLLMGMGDALRVKESELVYFFSQLEQLKEHSAVLNRSTEDARNLDLLRINAIEKKGLNLMEAVQLQSTRVNELLDHYEAAVKRMSCFFVKWDCIVSAKEKELMLYC